MLLFFAGLSWFHYHSVFIMFVQKLNLCILAGKIIYMLYIIHVMFTKPVNFCHHLYFSRFNQLFSHKHFCIKLIRPTKCSLSSKKETRKYKVVFHQDFPIMQNYIFVTNSDNRDFCTESFTISLISFSLLNSSNFFIFIFISISLDFVQHLPQSPCGWAVIKETVMYYDRFM